MKSKILLFFVFLSSASFAADLSYSEAKSRADSDEASLTPTQLEALVSSQGQAGGESFAVCPPPTPDSDLSPFTLVMELDASGKVTKTWLRGNSPIAVCFRNEMAKKSLFQPPRTPFYTAFGMSWKP